MSQESSFGNFDLVKHHALDFSDVSISKWRSRATGLNVIHLDYEAPIVKGYFVVPTEIFNDSGCPHTLEHLVFMGSEKYPFKGVLDNLANRAFSEGTNAWTDTDHTCYTISTAGEEGFLQLLPIYVDHILYPTITDHSFVTEVYHINPKGEDAGVVYSEMQGRENTPGDLMALRMSQLVNPSGSAYRSETGGLMEALRSLTVQQIRDYHRTYYVPYNLCLIIAGKVSTLSLLNVLQDQVEHSIMSHEHSRPAHWRRPFVETPTANRKPLLQTRSETVEFPEKDESAGELTMAFAGSAPNDYLTAKALEILASYLTSSPVAPLNKEFVEIVSPLCTGISIYENTRVTFCDLELYAASVPAEQLQTFDLRLKGVLRCIADAGLNMQRMQMILERDKRKFYSALESSGGDLFSGIIISEFLYGREDGGSLPVAMNEVTQFATLATWSEAQWIELLRKYFIFPPHAVIFGKPSAQLANRLEMEERARAEAQIKKLGPEGLIQAAKKLRTAQEYNDRPIPPEHLTSFPLPNAGSISWIPVQSAQNEIRRGNTGPVLKNSELERHMAQDSSDLPFFIQYDHVKSGFVTVHAFLSLEGLPDNLRPYITTYLGSFFSLPVKRQSTGSKMTHEEVINGLENETVTYDVGLGLDGYFNELVRISIKAEVARYPEAVSWLSDLIFRSEFDKERLEVTAAKIQQSLPEAKRDGNEVVSSLSGGILYASSSTSQAATVLNQVEFNPWLMERLKATPDEVVADMEQFRRYLTNPSGLRFGVTGNVLALPRPRNPWLQAFKPLTTTALRPIPLACNTLSPLGVCPQRKAVVMTLPSIESAYAIHSTNTIRGFDHPEYPTLRVTLEVLNATEGFLWRFIRGAGLAYGAEISLDVEAGLLSFSTYRSSSPFQAFTEARKVIQELADGTMNFDETTLDSCKSSIVYAVTKTVSTPGKAALTSFGNQVLRDLPQNHTVALLEKYQAVTIQNVTDALRTYFLPLFDPERSVVAVAAGPSKADGAAEGLASVGFEIERREILIDAQSDGNGDGEDSEYGTSDGSDESGGNR
ncbi:hypothetical protein K439DRAFT_1401667 [Ramaria rubella]|nr:hypothetical protein K439DRAFT_1401667 [Ramaria rubella]